MKKIISILLLLFFLISGFVTYAETPINYRAETLKNSSNDFKVTAESAILIETKTGTVLFSQNEKNKASPASVTKIMALLIVAEALEAEKTSLSDKVMISENAASMGGSQVFLKEGEEMTVEELLKCTVIASANDAAVALAEHICGNEENFVKKMNNRASELGLCNSNFENVTGLDDTTENHYSSAEDIAIMSMELIKHEIILKYSSIWQDRIRNGEFTLTNTNRLVRYYNGCNGLKTGSTDKAGYCVSATAKRGNMQLVAVIMGAPTRDDRNNAARTLLDYGFSNFSLYTRAEEFIENTKIYGGKSPSVALYSEPFNAVIPKGYQKSVELLYNIPESIYAPITESQSVGDITYKIGEQTLGISKIYVKKSIEKISFADVFKKIIILAFRKYENV